MFTLTVENNNVEGESKLFMGVSKRQCLKKFAAFMATLQDIQIDLQIEPKDKESSRLYVVIGALRLEVNGYKVEDFRFREDAVKRFLAICEEKGDHWEYEPEALFVEGVEGRNREMQKPPPSHDATEEAANKVIKTLDDSGYTREQVYAIACWVQYLATQS